MKDFLISRKTCDDDIRGHIIAGTNYLLSLKIEEKIHFICPKALRYLTRMGTCVLIISS